jgi:hypothetical protein
MRYLETIRYGLLVRISRGSGPLSRINCRVLVLVQVRLCKKTSLILKNPSIIPSSQFQIRSATLNPLPKATSRHKGIGIKRSVTNSVKPTSSDKV